MLALALWILLEEPLLKTACFSPCLVSARHSTHSAVRGTLSSSSSGCHGMLRPFSRTPRPYPTSPSPESYTLGGGRGGYTGCGPLVASRYGDGARDGTGEGMGEGANRKRCRSSGMYVDWGAYGDWLRGGLGGGAMSVCLSVVCSDLMMRWVNDWR